MRNGGFSRGVLRGLRRTARLLPHLAGVALLAAALALPAAAGEEPLSPADEQWGLAGALFARGEFVRAAGEYAEFARRHADDPRAAEGSWLQAESLYRAGEQAKARSGFERCLGLKLSPARLAAARLRIGAIQYAAGDAKSAAATLAATTLKDLPEGARPAAEYFLGAALLAEGRTSEAAPHLEAAAKGSAAALAAPALLALARQDSEAGRAAEAAARLEDLLKRFPRAAEAGEAAFRLAEHLRGAGKAAAALALYAQTLKLSPPGELAGRAALGAAWANLEKGDAVEARRMAELAARVPELKVEALYAEGLALSAAGSHAEAEAAFAEVVKLDPKGVRAEPALCRVAWCRYLAGRHAQVGLAAREFRARFPTGKLLQEVAYVEGLAAAATGDTQGALAALDRAAEAGGRLAAESAYRAALLCLEAGKADDARKRLEHLAQTHPRDRLADPALIRLGELELAAGRAKEATAFFDRHLAAFPDSAQRPAALLGKALCSAAAGDWDAFASGCTQLVQSHPADPRAAEAGYWLAWNLERQKTYDAAVKAYEALIEKNKTSPLVYEMKFRLCCAYYLNANFPKAAEGFLALARSGKRALPAEALLWLGKYLDSQKRAPEAAEAFEKAAASADPACRAEARMARGRQELDAGRAAEAVRFFEQALADDGRSPRADEAKLGLIRALRESGRPAEARAAAEKLVASRQERTRLAARGEVALADLAAGKAEPTLASLEPLAVLYDDAELVPRWLAGLADAELKLGRKEAARRWQRELITRYPASPEAAEASRRTGMALPKAPARPGEDF